MSQTQCRINVNGQTIEEIERWEYRSDVLVPGELATFTVVNKNHKYRDSLKLGDQIEFILSNEAVNGNTPCVKHRGWVVSRELVSDTKTGNTLNITSGDIGWHLAHNDGPLFANLLGVRWETLIGKDSKLFDPSWGITKVYFEGSTRARLKQGGAFDAKAITNTPDTILYLQVEPGEKVLDILMTYARREALLVNTSPDGALCFMRPRNAEPIYSIRCTDDGSENNVLYLSRHEDAETLFTEVTVVGDLSFPPVEGSNATTTDPNRNKIPGVVRNPSLLPFVHRKSVADADKRSKRQVTAQAQWALNRGIFDSFYVTYRMLGHHQAGHWYESDQTANVQDDESGTYGNKYVSAARCFGSKTEDDFTELTIRQLGVLSAGIVT